LITWTYGSATRTATYEGYYLSGGVEDPLLKYNGLYYLLGDTQVLSSYAIVQQAYANCYLIGTRIATPGGECAIERLSIGDMVLTAAGIARPVRWIGQRRHSALLDEGAGVDVWPIRIRAGALGAGRPHRDLLVSPEHGVFLDGVLVPARHLMDGIGITREYGLSEIHYFHIALDSHDLLVAEGSACESWLADGGADLFDNGASAPPVAGSDIPCAPRVTQGERLEAIRQRLRCTA
jgi:hypothetical protein